MRFGYAAASIATGVLALLLLVPVAFALPIGPEFPVWVGHGGFNGWPDVDADHLVWHAGSGQIWLGDFDGTTPTLIKDASSYSVGVPRVSGDVVVWADDRVRTGDVDIWGYRISTGQEFPIYTSPNASSAAVQSSPDVSGDVVVWLDYYEANGHGDIWGRRLSGGSEFPIVRDIDAQEEVVVSGNWVVWSEYSWNGGEFSIRGYDLDTQTEFTVCDHAGKQWHPEVSGNIVVWQDERDSNSRIFAYDLSTQTEFPISPASSWGAYPSVGDGVVVWQADGIWAAELVTGTPFHVIAQGEVCATGGHHVVWMDHRYQSNDLYGRPLQFWSGSIALAGGTSATAMRTVDATLAAQRWQRDVQDMRFSADGVEWSAWEPFAATKSLSLDGDDGLKTIRAQFRDSAEAPSPVAADDILLDTTAPSTSDDADADWHRTDVTLALSPSDAGSGVASTHYAVDGGPTLDGTSVLVPAPVDHSNDGAHTVEYWSVDAVGNTESPAKSCQVRIDTTAPETTDDAAASWLDHATTVGLTPSDADSGVKSTSYSLDNGAWIAWQVGHHHCGGRPHPALSLD